MRLLLIIGLISFILGCSDESAAPVDKATPLSWLDKPTVMAVRNLDTTQIERGRTVYLAHCTHCHGQNGEGTPDWRKTGADGKYPPPPLNGSAHTWHHSTEVLKKTILEVTPPELGSMPAWKDKLTEQQVDEVIVWIISLWPDEIYDVWYKNFKSKE
jgi:mono/diheme cytochrome c family protein